LPAQHCGAFNQALMELGSEICTPRAAACDRCPAASLCQARQQGLVAQIPRPSKRMKYEDVTEVAVVIRHRGRVALRRCQPGERWAGLWDFPRFAVESGNGDGAIAHEIASRTRDLVGLDIAPASHLVTIKHGVTRFRITLHCYQAQLQPAVRRKAGRIAAANPATWVSIDSLADYPLSVTGRKISRLLTPPKPS